LGQLDTLITLASSIVRNPAFTHDERKRRQTSLELLVDTAEQYQQDLECDHELFQVIALDAKGIPRSRLTAQQAANLLADASKIAKAPIEAANASPNKKPPRNARSSCPPRPCNNPLPRRAKRSNSTRADTRGGPSHI
jgi:hypothetical protein